MGNKGVTKIMKRRIHKLIPFIIMLLIILPLTNNLIKAENKESEESIAILFTHDLHSNFLTTKDKEDGVVRELGGYAKLKTAIDIERGKHPNSLLLDGGDYSMGTPFQTIFETDSSELRMLGMLGYDAITFGNHEFDYRATGLANSLNAAVESGDKLPEILIANMIYPTDETGEMTESVALLKQAMDDYKAKEYIVINKGDIKIGIFGLMGMESASMAPMSEVEFTDPIENAKRIVRYLKEDENVDLIICLSHSGIKDKKPQSEDEILAKKVPEIDLIISGHTHSKLIKPIIIGKTHIVSGHQYGYYLGKLKMVKSVDNRWELEGYDLIPIDNKFQEDVNVAEKIEGFKEIVEEKYFSKFNLTYDQIIATNDIDFQTSSEILDVHKESTLGNFISDAFIYAVKEAEGDDYIPIAVSVVPAGTIRETFFKGDITVADAFNVSSLGIGKDKVSGYPLISVYLTGKELKTACEVDASVQPLMKEAQLFMSGINYIFNPNRLIFNKVTESYLINENGEREEIKDDKLYRVVAGLYSGQMLSVVGDKSFNILSVVPKTKDGIPIVDFEAEAIYHKETGSELKEWYAIVEYMRSFEGDNGIAEIPEYYATTDARKVVDNDKNIISIIKNPNKMGMIVYGLIALVTFVVIFGGVRIIKRLKKFS